MRSTNGIGNQTCSRFDHVRPRFQVERENSDNQRGFQNQLEMSDSDEEVLDLVEKRHQRTIGGRGMRVGDVRITLFPY